MFGERPVSCRPIIVVHDPSSGFPDVPVELRRSARHHAAGVGGRSTPTRRRTLGGTHGPATIARAFPEPEE
jgi:hypothetical protein